MIALGLNNEDVNFCVRDGGPRGSGTLSVNDTITVRDSVSVPDHQNTVFRRTVQACAGPHYG